MSNPPAMMYGFAPAGATVQAFADGNLCASAKAGQDGLWMMQIPEGPAGVRDGTELSFTLDGVLTSQNEVWQTAGAPADVASGVTLHPVAGNVTKAGVPRAPVASRTSSIGVAEILPSLEDLARKANAVDWDEALWTHVGVVVDSGMWAQAASLVGVFLEDTLRRWAGLGPDSRGAELAAKAIGRGGPLELGFTPGETDGWVQLTRGFFQGIRNVDNHNIQARDDLKRYALGVLGVANLIVTQVRHQHPDVNTQET